MEKLILAGGKGYLGQLLQIYFKDKYDIYILTRSKSSIKDGIHFTNWDGKNLGEWTKILEDATAVINLSGRNINTQFTEKNKKAILQSRLESTEILGKAIEKAKNPPKIWLNASSIAIYEESFSEVKDENSPVSGKDFLSEVSKKWEESFYKYANEKTKKAIFRISIIMGNHKGSAYHSLKKIVKLGAGGKAGSGKQMVSWLGEKDFVRAIHFIIENQLQGAFNFCNPYPISNADMMKQLQKKYKIPFGLPAPEFLIRIGAKLLGTAPELILRSQNAAPKRLLEAGFVFEQNDLKDI